jgi:mRNA-degrading endonuclease YafQ of YafQ-DinJ toxin-antitoxin module
MGIPDRADQYGLSDADIPPGMKDVAFDKKTFAEKVHAFKLTPSQAKGLWETYTTMVKDIYQKAVDSKNQQMTQLSNRLRGEWADAYETKVEMGQMVINKFASDQDAINFVTAAIAADPRGVKFLAKIGEQFAENKIGDFAHKRYSFTPDEAQAEINKITADPNHPYNNEKALAADHQRAVDYVNSLYSILSKAKTG